MHRPLIVIALLAAPAFAASQTPAAEASAHPASRAHDNAMAAQADAALIEACSHAARGFLDDLEKGDFKTATANFDGQMEAAVSPDKLGETWKSLAARFGRLESRGNPQTVMYRDMPVVTTPLHFAKGDLVSQLACDSEGRIAGFYVRPVPGASVAPEASPE
ncbi:MAG TPA: DUF3887 domain-containing protein [Rhodanobacteraceae bacterium]|jgi:hypothetical protein|nr:DUF3887 domain-containing protein [Rhodanobacteraceae bacterium]